MISKVHKLLAINVSDFMFISEHCIVIFTSKRTDGHMEYDEIEFVGYKVLECLIVEDEINTALCLRRSIEMNKVLLLVRSEEIYHDQNIEFINFNHEYVHHVGKYGVLGIFTFDDTLEPLHCLYQVSKYKNKINGKGMSHYGTYGNVYGFGFCPSFKLDEEGLSIGEYVIKKKVKKCNEDKFEEIKVNLKTYMLKCLDTQYRILKFDVKAFFKNRRSY